MYLPPEIQYARNNLENGKDRFWETPVNLRLSWFPEYLQPDFGEELLSNYGLLSGGGDLSAEFWEEIEAIDKSFGDELPEELKDWRKSGAKAAGDFMDYKLNRRATVFSLWDSYGAPLRLKNGNVYRIWAPKDLMGDPIVKSLPIKNFLPLVCIKTASDYLEIKKLNKKVQTWQSIFAITLLLLISCIAYIFR